MVKRMDGESAFRNMAEDTNADFQKFLQKTKHSKKVSNKKLILSGVNKKNK